MSEQPTYAPGVLATAEALLEYRRRTLGGSVNLRTTDLVPQAEFILSRTRGSIEAAARAVERGWWEERYPCDGGCSDAPEEDCSRHGRKPAELWAIINEQATTLRAVRDLAEKWENDADGGADEFPREARVWASNARELLAVLGVPSVVPGPGCTCDVPAELWMPGCLVHPETTQP